MGLNWKWSIFAKRNMIMLYNWILYSCKIVKTFRILLKFLQWIHDIEQYMMYCVALINSFKFLPVLPNQGISFSFPGIGDMIKTTRRLWTQ